MKRNILTLTAACIATMALSAPALASSMPKADFGRSNTLGLGVGNGVSLSIDFPVSGDLSLGGALSAQGFVSNTADLRLLYKLMPGGTGRLHLDLLGGVQIYGPRFGQFTSFDPFIGVALAYPFTSRLTGRLNVAGAFNTGGLGFNGTRASGIELAYEFSPNLEGTIGANGRGDFLGLKFGF
jgi:hypothetical protein